MSLLKLKGNPAGGGLVTVQSPASTVDRVLTLPDVDGGLAAQALITRITMAGASQHEVLNIPEWVGRITLDFTAVTGGSDGTVPRVQLGVTNATYPLDYAGTVLGEGAGGASGGFNLGGIGALIFGTWATTSLANGSIVFTRVLHTPGGSSRWAFSVNSGHSSAVYAAHGAGYGDFTTVVDRLRFTSNGANFTGGFLVVRLEA